MSKGDIDVSALYGFEAGLREGAGELAAALRRAEGWRTAALRLRDALNRDIRSRCSDCQIEADVIVELREKLRRAEGEKATLRAALELVADTLTEPIWYTPEHIKASPYLQMVQAVKDALAGTGDEVGAVVRAAVAVVPCIRGGGQDMARTGARRDAIGGIESAVADLLAKQPGVWEVRRDG